VKYGDQALSSVLSYERLFSSFGQREKEIQEEKNSEARKLGGEGLFDGERRRPLISPVDHCRGRAGDSSLMEWEGWC